MTRQITPIQLPAGSVMPGEIALPQGDVLIGNSSNVAVATALAQGQTIVGDASGHAVAVSLFSGRNKIINGDMRIDQRNAGASFTPVSQSRTLDRWNCTATPASKYSVQQNAGAVAPPVGFGFYAGVTSLSAYTPASTDVMFFSQYIEGLNIADLGWGTANAQAITVSFWAYSSLTGQFGGAVGNSAHSRAYPFAYTINVANTWEKKTITIPGDVTGTWLVTNGRGILLSFGLGVGSTLYTTAGAWAAGQYYSSTGSTDVVATSGATWYVTGVQLEAGSIATAFENVDYTTMLNRCQRYYTKTFTAAVAPAQSAGLVGAISVKNPIALGDPAEWWQFPVIMRANPTVVTYNPSAANANWRDVTAAADATVSVDPATSIGMTGVLIATSGTVTALGDILCIHATAEAEL